MSKWFNIAFWI